MTSFYVWLEDTTPPLCGFDPNALYTTAAHPSISYLIISYTIFTTPKTFQPTQDIDGQTQEASCGLWILYIFAQNGGCCPATQR